MMKPPIPRQAQSYQARMTRPHMQPAHVNPSRTVISNSVQRKPASQAPPVYRPANAAVAAPPVYRPNAAPSLQQKPVNEVARPANRTVTAPPVYRPNMKASLQQKPAGAAPPAYRPVNATLTAPPVYRPKAGVSLQQKRSVAPPVYSSKPAIQPQRTPGRTVASDPTRQGQRGDATSCGTKPTVLQRKILVTGGYEWVEEQLNKLVAPDLVSVEKDGSVTVIITTPDDDTRSPVIALLGRLIDSPHTIKISPHNENTGAINTTEHLEHASNPEMGSGSEIKIGKGTQKSVIMDNGHLIASDTPPWIILGHELIHADRAAKGGSVKRGVFKDYKVTGKWDGKSGFGTHMASREEVETVGLTGDHDITENSIRSFHKLPSVAIYEMNVDDWINNKFTFDQQGDSKKKVKNRKTSQ